MIKTERLVIEPIDIKYYKDLLEIWSDFETIKYTYLELIESEEESLYRLMFWVDNHLNHEYPNILVINLDEKAIGIIGFPVINKEKEEFGLFYNFNKDYWNKGYAQEAVKGAIDYLYKEYKNAVIYADAVILNLASLRILKKLGFIEMGKDKNAFKFNDFELDLVKFKYNK